MNDNTEAGDSVNPFWVENGSRIRKIVGTIAHPRTEEGKKLFNSTSSYQIFQSYPRLHPIYGAIIRLAEEDEIDKRTNNGNYFSDPNNQRVVLKAFGLFVEQSIMRKTLPLEKGYDYYKGFFEKMRKQLIQADSQIQKGEKSSDLVPLLTLTFFNEISSLYSSPDFEVGIGVIRREVAKSVTSDPTEDVKVSLET